MVEIENRFRPSRLNMSGLILMRIADMQTRAANYYRQGNFQAWFFEWKNIKFQIIGKLTNDEQEILSNLEAEIIRVLQIKHEVVPLIEKYLTQIQIYLEEKEIGLAGKQDETRFL